METGERFRELAEKLGGFNEQAMHALFYANNPFALKHWTMNVVELLLIGGAVMGLLHAIAILRRSGNPTNLGLWVASVVFVFAVEIPAYFPTLIGADANSILFVHNEFTLGLFYDRTPLYVVALYPALMYPSYVLVERAGLFGQGGGIAVGALATGFFHHCLYEIFDHFGPQYGWWAWNYAGFHGTLASVPITSMFSFAFLGPLSLVLLSRLLITSYVTRREVRKAAPSGLHVAGLAFLVGMLTPLLLSVLSPENYYRMIVSTPNDVTSALIMFAILATAGGISLYHLYRAEPRDGRKEGEGWLLSAYPFSFLVTYLVVFAGLWVSALPDYLRATQGITESGMPTGSLGYIVGCYVLCSLILYRAYSGKPIAAPSFAPTG